MPVDTSIYGRIEQPDVGNALAGYGQALQARALQGQNQLQKLQLQQAQQSLNEQNALRSAYAGATDPTTGQIDYSKVYGALAQNNAGNQIPGVAKSQMEMRAMQLKQAQDALSLQKNLSTQVMAAPTQANAQASLDQMEAITGKGSMAAERQRVQAMGDDPNQIKAWAIGHAVDADKLLPQFQKIDNGGQTVLGTTNPLTGQLTPTQTITKTATIGEQESQRHNRIEEGQGAQKIGLEAATLAETKRFHDMTAGSNLNPDGTPNANMQAMVDMVGQGKVPATEVTGRMQAPQKAAFLSALNKQYPDYDYTTVGAKAQAAKSFATGPLGNSLRSVSTANAHLDQLGTMVDALNNGDVPLLNKLGNAWATQTGQTAPTNFNAIKNVVGQEVVKAIVAGGGGVGEREEAANAFNAAGSPAQLKGVISHYREVMEAQRQNLLAQRRAAGLPDSTLPNYTGHQEPAPSAPPPQPGQALGGGWKYLGTQ